MLGLWNEGDWLKEIFGLAQSMVKWYVEVPDLVGFFIWLIRAKFLLSLISKCTCYYVALMVVLSLLSIWLYVGYNHAYMTDPIMVLITFHSMNFRLKNA